MTTPSRIDLLEKRFDDLSIEGLVARAEERVKQERLHEKERRFAELLVKREKILQQIHLAEKLFDAACFEALQEFARRVSEQKLPFLFSEGEKELLSGEIAWNSRKIRGTTWQKFSDFHASEIRKCRTNMWSYRNQLKYLDASMEQTQ